MFSIMSLKVMTFLFGGKLKNITFSWEQRLFLSFFQNQNTLCGMCTFWNGSKNIWKDIIFLFLACLIHCKEQKRTVQGNTGEIYNQITLTEHKSRYFKEKASAEATFMWVLECEESHWGN